VPFSLEDKHTMKVLRQQKLYGATKILRMFWNKNWRLSGVQTVLSKIDATGSVDRSGSGRPRTARSPDTISDVQDLLSGSEPRRLCGVGNPTRACVQASTDHGRGRAASVFIIIILFGLNHRTQHMTANANEHDQKAQRALKVALNA